MLLLLQAQNFTATTYRTLSVPVPSMSRHVSPRLATSHLSLSPTRCLSPLALSLPKKELHKLLTFRIATRRLNLFLLSTGSRFSGDFASGMCEGYVGTHLYLHQ